MAEATARDGRRQRKASLDEAGPARAPRISDAAVDRVRRLISSQGLQRGDQLPRERDLAERWGISRSTLREALRTLEAAGAVQVRAGARGGIFVSEPGPAQIAESLTPVLTFDGASDDEVVEYAVGLISDAAYWASIRADRDALTSIRCAQRRLVELTRVGGRPWPAVRLAHLELIETLARSTRNRVRVALILGLHPVLMRRASPPAVVAPATMATAGAVVEAVGHRDGPDARRLMYEHLCSCLSDA